MSEEKKKEGKWYAFRGGDRRKSTKEKRGQEKRKLDGFSRVSLKKDVLG